MIRPLFTIASLSSTLLCTACIILWLESYRTEISLQYAYFRFTDPLQNDGTIPQDHYGEVWITSSRGRLWLSFTDETQDASGLPNGEDEFKRPLKFLSDRQFTATPDASPRWQVLGFWYDANTSLFTFQCGAPIAALLLPAAILPAAYFLHRRKRPARGCCLSCGYDLRASKDRCPECGTAIASH